MVTIIAAAVLMGSLLIVHGIRIIATGTAPSFPAIQRRPMRRLGWPERINYATFYVIIGMGLIAAPVDVIVESHVTLVGAKDWVAQRTPQLVAFCFLAGFGLCGLFRPAIIAGWAKGGYRQLSEEEERFTIIMVRAIGAGFIFGSIVMLLSL